MTLNQPTRFPGKFRKLALVALLIFSLTLLGQSLLYFSSKTGLPVAQPNAADEWTSAGSGTWAVNPYDRNTIIRATGSELALSSDGGTEFHRIEAPFDPMQNVAFFFDAADSKLLFAASAANLSASVDGGDSWMPLSLPNGFGDGSASAPHFTAENDGRTHLFAASGAQLWEATYESNATQWQLTLSANGSITSLAVSDDQSTIAAATDKGYVHVRKSLVSTQWDQTLIRSGVISGIAFHPSDNQRFAALFEAGSNSPNPLIYVTTNGGRQFAAVSGLPGKAVRGIAFVGQGDDVRLYAFASSALLTRDLRTWFQEAGLVRHAVSGLTQIDTGDGIRLAATNGDQVYIADLPAISTCSFSPKRADAQAAGGTIVIELSHACDLAPSFPDYPARIVEVADGSVTLAVNPNNADTDRNLFVRLGTRRLIVHQRGLVSDAPDSTLPPGAPVAHATANCQIMSVTPSKVGKGGGKVTISVRKTSACGPIVVDTTVPLWIDAGLPVITADGTKSITISVNSNPGTARSGSVTFNASSGSVAGAPVKISQDAGSTCNGVTGTLSTPYFDAPATTATLTLKVSGTCTPIQVKSNQPWITIHSGGATNQYSVQLGTNPGSERSGTITISNATRKFQEVLITQDGVPGSGGGASPPPTTNKCTSVKGTLSATSFAVTGGSATLTVTTAGTCTPSVSASSWITVKASGANRYTVTVASNAGQPARQGSITVKDAGGVSSNISVNQSGVQTTSACTGLTSTLSPASFPQAASTGALTVKATGTCGALTATSDSTWLTATSSGANSFAVKLVANTSAARSGKITVHVIGSTITSVVTVQQAVGTATAACTYKVSPTTLAFKWSGGAVPVTVTTNLATCAWTLGAVQSNFGSITWVHLSKTQGTGTGTVTISVDSDADSIVINNTQGRSATVTVAGVMVTINQDPLIPNPRDPDPCNPTGGGGANIQFGVDKSSFAASGGQATITLLAPSNCHWTLDNTGASWSHFANGSTGIGNGKVIVNIDPFTGTGTRSAVFTSPQATPALNGHTAQVTITQKGN